MLFCFNILFLPLSLVKAFCPCSHMRPPHFLHICFIRAKNFQFISWKIKVQHNKRKQREWKQSVCINLGDFYLFFDQNWEMTSIQILNYVVEPTWALLLKLVQMLGVFLYQISWVKVLTQLIFSSETLNSVLPISSNYYMLFDLILSYWHPSKKFEGKSGISELQA